MSKGRKEVEENGSKIESGWGVQTKWEQVSMGTKEARKEAWVAGEVAWACVVRR